MILFSRDQKARHFDPKVCLFRKKRLPLCRHSLRSLTRCTLEKVSTISEAFKSLAFFVSAGLARFARSPWLASVPQSLGRGAVGQRSASPTALAPSLIASLRLAPAGCPLAELARYARSRALATLASSRWCRMASAPTRVQGRAMWLQPHRPTECPKLQPPRHPYGSLALPLDAFSYNNLSPTSPPRLPHGHF